MFFSLIHSHGTNARPFPCSCWIFVGNVHAASHFFRIRRNQSLVGHKMNSKRQLALVKNGAIDTVLCALSDDCKANFLNSVILKGNFVGGTLPCTLDRQSPFFWQIIVIVSVAWGLHEERCPSFVWQKLKSQLLDKRVLLPLLDEFSFFCFCVVIWEGTLKSQKIA